MFLCHFHERLIAYDEVVVLDKIVDIETIVKRQDEYMNSNSRDSCKQERKIAWKVSKDYEPTERQLVAKIYEVSEMNSVEVYATPFKVGEVIPLED